MIAQTVYILCGLTSIWCAFLLYRSYRSSRTPLLFWSTGCFVFLAVSNILLFIDMIVFPTSIDLSIPRSLTTLAGILMLLYGIIRERT